MFHDDRTFNRPKAVVCIAMCHHAEMAIDWQEAVSKTESHDERDETETVDEPELDTEESTPEVTHPADD